MANIINQYGQVKVGVRNATPIFSSLLTSLYSAYNADTTITTLNNNLIATYKGENNVNDSLGTYNGVAQGGLTYVTGKSGNAFQFNGTNAYVQLPNNSFNFTDNFSVSMWVNFQSMAWQNGQLIDNACFGAIGTTGWRLYYLYGSLGFYNYRDNQLVYIETNQLNQANVWYHITATLGSSGMKLYLNGLLVASSATSQKPNYLYTVNTTLGSNKGYNQFTTCTMDEVNIWNKELTSNEVSALYNSGSGVFYPSLSSVTIVSANDSLGVNNGTAQGGLTYGVGKVGNAFQFNGTNSYVSFPTNSWNSLVGTDLTISLWVKFASTANQTLISNMSAPSVNVWNGWEIRLSSGQPIFYSWNNGGNTAGAVGSSVTTNTWYHIVATKTGNSYKIYMNGSLISTGSGPTNAVVNGTFYPNIGHLQYASNFHALYVTNGTLIDAVNLWPRELLLKEITELYNTGNGKQYPF